ncbi:hypothetical protein CDIK_3581 [Cucumispora dikerogammari]|nr:hypothetical protein CDIK_3581 [Cucumispora dikerogammari]
MRKLFFTDFIPFCYEFFTNINRMILVEQKKGGCFHYLSLSKMFSELDSSNNFSKANDINMKFIEDISDPDISFTYLLNILESIVEEHSGNSTELIRKCLYFNPGFVFDVKNIQNIRDFYHTITYFFKYYGADLLYTHDAKTVSCYYAKIINTRILNAAEVFKLLIDYYQEHLIISIRSEYISSIEVCFGTRFKEYRRCMLDLYGCCLNPDSNLIAVCCKKHQVIIRKIKEERCGNIFFDFYDEKSFFNDTILYTIDDIYSEEYKTRVSETDQSESSE